VLEGFTPRTHNNIDAQKPFGEISGLLNFEKLAWASRSGFARNMGYPRQTIANGNTMPHFAN
jgi:hypothetical protein